MAASSPALAGQDSRVERRNRPIQLANLQILRLVAAAMVLFGHLNHEVTKLPLLARGFEPFQPIWWHCGVDIFFVLSGFVMALITADSFGQPGTQRRFVTARLLRLVPMYWLFTSLTLVAMLTVPGEMRHHTTNWQQVLGSYLFVPLTLNSDGAPRPVMILGWTLDYEMLFYALFALVLPLGRRRGLTVLAGIIVALVALGRLVALPLPFSVWCDPIVLEFLLGVAVYGGWRRGHRLPAWAGLAIAAEGFAAMAAFMAGGIANHYEAWRIIWGGIPAAMIVAGVLVIREVGTGRVAARIDGLRRLLVLGGDASYALYLSHPFVLSGVALLCARAGLHDAPFYVASAFAACLGFALLFHVKFERPLLALLRFHPARTAAMPRPALSTS